MDLTSSNSPLLLLCPGAEEPWMDLSNVLSREPCRSSIPSNLPTTGSSRGSGDRALAPDIGGEGMASPTLGIDIPLRCSEGGTDHTVGRMWGGEHYIRGS